MQPIALLLTTKLKTDEKLKKYKKANHKNKLALGKKTQNARGTQNSF